MKWFQSLFAVALAGALAAGCGGGETDRPAVGMDSAGGMQGMHSMDSGMQGMGGQQGGMMGGRMMDEMQQHMQAMMGVSADSMRAMMPMHRQMAGNMLSMMNREMQEMNMTGDTAWSATMDSVRQDLVRMPEMNAQELRAFMPAHRDRLMRLMEMHRAMMGRMAE